ncbi:DNA repair protein complementing XP-A cells homolog isoform X2 [Neodiprion fabricii]|uniref:DNA repair protein complementing XP-A cells homolog isoform X1 n=1 Tax=Neodiprion fabricii TaxID=2872261 RepID=UPI001ED935A9|nr:DNA repair protein complementing XP-A cells homolog isoform X1 [Neodiprion fabricii]XP_046433684.1 DNA repair protein complementing XP-A cells homolog isoform X2 [Neodiprion fabricii]
MAANTRSRKKAVNETDQNNTEIHADLLKRAEKNRQKALLLKKAKLIAHPYAKEDNTDTVTGRLVKVRGQRVIDSGGGFLIEEDDELEQQMLKITSVPAPIISKLPICNECLGEFKDSYLFQTFDLLVCDKCRDNEDKHSLITRTEAKQEYLLKDCDLDKREPPLKYIAKKNPHNVRWGEMKMYLHLQVEKRALEVWGSEEALLEEREKRDVKRQEGKIKKFNKKVKQLRMNVRSSMYDKTKASHTHEFGEDTYNEEDDNYSHTCETCGYEEIYEKM